MDVMTFRYLISLVVSGKLNIQHIDVVTVYLCEDLDTVSYMKTLEGLTLTGSNNSRPWNTLSVRMRKITERVWMGCGITV